MIMINVLSPQAGLEVCGNPASFKLKLFVRLGFLPQPSLLIINTGDGFDIIRDAH